MIKFSVFCKMNFKDLSMVVTYSFVDDKDQSITDDFLAMLIDKFGMTDEMDQSTLSLPFDRRDEVASIKKAIADWIENNSRNIKQNSHVTYYEASIRKNEDGENCPSILKCQWIKQK